MANLIIAPERMHDEILYSYILRLAQINLFAKPFWFINYLNNAPIGRQHYPRYDSFTYLGGLFSHINGLDWSEFFMNSTIYPVIAPFLLSSKQTGLLTACFSKQEELKFTSDRFIKHMKICPKCREEMISKYGFWWYMKSQNLPLVTTCKKHKCKLIEYSGSPWHELGNEDFSEIDLPTNYKFDEFIRSLAIHPLDCSLEDLMPVILKKVDDEGINVIEKKYHESGLESLVPMSIPYVRKNNLPTKSEMSWEKAMVLLYLCFGSIENVPSVEYDKDFITDFFQSTKGFKVFYPYRNNLVEMEHEECGTHFLTTPNAFMDGWSCPSCMSYLSPEENFSQILELNGYKLLSPFRSLTTKVEVKHLCGKKYEIQPRDFLFQGIRCTCESQVSRKEAQERIKPIKLIRFSGAEKPATFRCPDCGKAFTMNFRNREKREVTFYRSAML